MKTMETMGLVMGQEGRGSRGRRLAWRGALSLLLLALAAGGCPKNDGQDGGTDASVTDSRAATISDAEIAMVVRRANDGEIQQGQLAVMRATSPDVRLFAQRMVDEHGAANQRQMTLFTDRGITPADSDLSRQLAMEATQALDMLRGVTDNPADLGPSDGGTGDGGGLGSAFDRAYMDVQVTMHTRVLELLDNTLLPAVRDTSLQGELRMVRTDVQSHLNDARTLRDRLTQ